MDSDCNKDWPGVKADPRNTRNGGNSLPNVIETGGLQCESDKRHEERHGYGSSGSLAEEYRKLIRDYHLWWKQAKAVPYTKLFKYADKYDILLMVVGFVGAVINGLTLPSMLLIQSHLINNFGSLQDDPNQMSKKVSQESLYFVYAALLSWIASYLEVSCWMHTGQRQSARIRAKYVAAVLRQDVAFFDCETSTAEVVNNISAETQLLQEAISEKVGHFIKSCSHFVGGYMVAFSQLWKLALLMIPFTPFLLFPGVLYSIAVTDFALKTKVAYGNAGRVAEQAISSVRTVYSFAAEKRTVEAYSESLEAIVDLGKKQGLAGGLAIGSNGIVFALWALLGWYGAVLITRGEANGGEVLTTGFAVLTGGLALGNGTPHVKSFFQGCISAYKIFEMIDRIPPIDVGNASGLKPDKVQGRMEFIKVDFAYPSRIETLVLKSFNLEVSPGKKIALVGSSGSGKSTVISLLERYYDPLSGQILLDGINIKDLQLKWLRHQIGLVNQEPSLFAASIKENILVGKERASISELIEAASVAAAHDFIIKLPRGYDTQVGERGVQMSGGQKQRIAIARAVLKKPPILLLDEATSALDSESEKIVQQALDNASVGRTTLVVAHRLSTICNADLIAVVQNGFVVEIGTHEELLEKGEAYGALFHLQQGRHETEAADQKKITSGIQHCPVENAPHLISEVEKDIESSEFIRAFPIKKHHNKPSFGRLFSLNKPEWKQGMLGLAGAFGFGIVQPLYAYTVGNTVAYYYSKDYHKMKEHIKIYSLVFMCLAVASFIVSLMQHYNFAVMGENLTKRIRKKLLSKILTFEVAWFDQNENSTGALCSRLASDANLVRSLIGDRISLLVQTASAVTVSIIIALARAWRLALVMTAIQPFVIYCYFYRKRSLIEFARQEAQSQQEACQIASEAVSLQRTVTAFSAQDMILSRFETKLAKARKQIRRQSQFSGLCIGAAQFILFASWGLDFWYGGQLVKKGLESFGDVFMTFFVLVSTGRVLAEAGTLTPDIAKGTTAVEYVFKILDRVTEIDSNRHQSDTPEKIRGEVELRGVFFAYPSRPDVVVFRNLNLTIQAGCTVALVGHSGSGKSTIIGLIERFYDPQRGQVMIDGRNIKNMHLQSLRQHIGLVNQEPTLFAASIRENIAYGKHDCSEEEIIEAARAANAHNFICALPNGYSTFAGEQGVQLSGGQKQRIAIARAMLKNPEILLLDEATSALDAESERLVEEALDEMMVGRTTVVIAHRLSTIRDADTIVLLQDGSIQEQGNHEELIARGEGGAYFNLIALQQAATSSKMHV